MNQFFRKLPLAVKLILIGLVPLIFIIYLTLELYREKTAKLQGLRRNIEEVNQSANLAALINSLQEERKLSFDNALGKVKYNDLLKIRTVTDSLLRKVENSDNPSVQGFREYTSMDRLMDTRRAIDTGSPNPNVIMHNYSNTIFRLNTLNTVPQSLYLQPVYNDMVAQKLLTEISTYLGIIRSNIYNVLVTRQYMVETLIGTTGTYDVYRSYEKEFLMKSSPAAREAYQRVRSHGDLQKTNEYIDTLFRRFRFDSTLTADQWWQISNNGMAEISNLQKTIWNAIAVDVLSIYNEEKLSRNKAIILFVLILLGLTGLISYTAIVITTMLRDLRIAAQKIARGKTAVVVKRESNDVIGSLGDCIAEIASSNRELAAAAKSIGDGNFEVKIFPRSEEDVLVNAIIQMKEALKVYSQKMEGLVKERTDQLENSNRDLQQFAHVVSHDLKEPLRKINFYSSRLLADENTKLSENSKNYLAKVTGATIRMSNMIDGILSYSSAEASTGELEMVDLTSVAANVKTDLEVMIAEKNGTVTIGDLPRVEGAPVLLNQLIYNLVNNSLKFAKDDVPPAITLVSRKLSKHECAITTNESCFEILIEDNGIGFEPEEAKVIFNTFTRLHSKSKYEGTGLGLSLCKRIVEFHGGTISAKSNGVGASFRIVLPERQTRH